MRELSLQDIRDIIMGCTILGTGGGGDPALGLAILEKDFRDGHTFWLEDLLAIPDEGYIASPYVCGAISPESAEEQKKYERFHSMEMPTPAIAFEKLEEYFEEAFYGVISTELGGANTAYALHIGAILGKVIVDGDFAGRSVPGVQHNTCNLCNVSMTPFAVASKFGDAAVFTDVFDENRAEDLLRALSVASQNNIGVADHPAKGRIIKECSIPGALSMAMELGQIVRRAKEKGLRPVDEIVKTFQGRFLFYGEADFTNWETVNGYTEGRISLQGEGDFKGDTYEIWFQNENIISWKNGLADVTVPDLICVMDEAGEPVLNPLLKAGELVSVFALPAPEMWTSKEGLRLLGPKSFGFDIEYRSVKSL